MFLVSRKWITNHLLQVLILRLLDTDVVEAESGNVKLPITTEALLWEGEGTA